MNRPQDTPKWYLDIREMTSNELTSLDLTRHLPRRLRVGPVAVVTEAPRILLPVIRKRWVKLIREAERERASTLNSFKKESLGQEIIRLRSYQFTSKTSADYPDADVFFVALNKVSTQPLNMFWTVYILSSLSRDQFRSIITQLPSGGLIVVYGRWTADYEQVVHEIFQQKARALVQFGEGPYPDSSSL